MTHSIIFIFDGAIDISKNGALFPFFIIIIFWKLFCMTWRAPLWRSNWLLKFNRFYKPLFLFYSFLFHSNWIHGKIFFFWSTLWVEKARWRTFLAVRIYSEVSIFLGGVLGLLSFFDWKQLDWVGPLCVRLGAFGHFQCSM